MKCITKDVKGFNPLLIRSHKSKIIKGESQNISGGRRIETMKEPKQKKLQPLCPKCGSEEFVVRYIETAHARINRTGEVIEDGLNLVHHEDHWDQVWCAGCNRRIKWIGEV